MTDFDEPQPRRRRPRDPEGEDDRRRTEKRRGRTSRVYVHDDCGGETEISGDDLTRLANPFAWVSQTYCASCQKHAGLRRFSWADTDEDLASYRRRLRRHAPLTLKLWCWLFGPVIGVLVGMVVGLLLTRNDPMKGVIGGGVCGAAFFGFFLVQYLSKRFWRIDYRNKR